MSGIVGLYRLNDRAAEERTLLRMVDAIAHRGPDGSGTWHHGTIGLGHRMLWTTPESVHERLPLVSDDGRRALTADARIDNREELITALDLTGTPSEQITDSALILAAYERWGEDCVDYLTGDFAFALWDEGKKSLFCARDQIGCKPFYYFCSDSLFVLASEIKALLCLSEVPRTLNEVAIACHLTSIDDDPTMTIYEDILRLPAAHSITITSHGTSLRQYWALDPTREIHYDTDEEYEHAFHDLFTEAVRCRLRSAFPVGSQLSGGLDSSSVVCVARDLLRDEKGRANFPPSPLRTFSALFGSVPESDESPYINVVLAAGDLEPHFVEPQDASPLVDVERILWNLDDLSETPPLYVVLTLFRSAQEANIRVLLDGECGDATVGYGYEYYRDLARDLKWYPLLKETSGCARNFHVPLRQVLWTTVIFPSIQSSMPGAVRKMWRRLRHFPEVPYADKLFVNTGFVDRIGFSEQIAARDKSDAMTRSVREEHYRALTEPWHQRFLEELDKAAAAFSIDVRHPFYDRRLIEFCLGLPSHHKYHHGWARAIERNALAGHLPAAVRSRTSKTYRDEAVLQGLLKHDRARIEHVIFVEPQLIERYADVTSLQEAYHRFVARTDGALHAALSLWRIMVLVQWLKRHTWQTGT